MVLKARNKSLAWVPSQSRFSKKCVGIGDCFVIYSVKPVYKLHGIQYLLFLPQNLSPDQFLKGSRENWTQSNWLNITEGC